MKNWQRYWLLFAIAFAGLHTIRDVLQFFKVETTLSTIVVRTPVQSESLLWHPLNTVVIELTVLALAISAYRRNWFGWQGKATLLIAIATVLGFCWYWFLLE